MGLTFQNAVLGVGNGAEIIVGMTEWDPQETRS